MPPRIRLILAGLYLTIFALVGVVTSLGLKEDSENWQGLADAYFERGNAAIDTWKAGEPYTADRDAEVHRLLHEGIDLPATMNLRREALATKMLILNGSDSLLILLCLFLIFRSWQVRHRARRISLILSHSLLFLNLMASAITGAYVTVGPGKLIVPTMPPNETRFLSNVSARVGQSYTQKQHDIMIQFVEFEQRTTNVVSNQFGTLIRSVVESAGVCLGVVAASAALALWPVKKQPEQQEPALLP